MDSTGVVIQVGKKFSPDSLAEMSSHVSTFISGQQEEDRTVGEGITSRMEDKAS